MNKSDLVERLAVAQNVPPKQAEVMVEFIINSMTAALVRGERIEIRGFGSFVARAYRARTGRNPRSGLTIHVPPKRLPFFKVGKELKDLVDKSRNEAPLPGSPGA